MEEIFKLPEGTFPRRAGEDKGVVASIPEVSKKLMTNNPIGRINKEGYLELKRKGEWWNCFCPFNNLHDKCGSTCPLFGEPVDYKDFTQLELCKTTWHLYEFKDLR